MSKQSVNIVRFEDIDRVPTHFANGLENRDRMLEVTNMKHWDDQFDVRVMTNAVHGVLATGFAKCAFI
jgi:hypothetical protein